MENWKDIIGFEGYYQISDLGRVKSLERTIIRSNGRVQHVRERIRIPYRDGKGYLFVHLLKDGERTMFKIHRLVSIHFIPNPENKPEVNHLKTKDDNDVNSLEWVTSKENSGHAESNNLIAHAKGIKNAASKLTEQQVREIRLLKGKMNQREIAKLYGVSHPIIGHIFRNEYWTHVL